ncbi:hypothetical protein EDD28_0559 [Salana multivorans]|uniref:Uncharacterized protein n=1 Tax=Salana multivorans TaxID=120377 RepID=A0A3N2D880_9MICO|nr:hypothetical protein [Salana multivorans]MBN8881689.1 hypothetical protein [Salana multivorans]OJX93941.1 MAG: hypothetical protein BGO96_00295 [Micrococcales bacterium 73-15]ROR95989.1 hypothetical protein EDD28_0559 [Salana multivorans]
MLVSIVVACVSTAGMIVAAVIAATASRRSQAAVLALEVRKTDHARITALETRVDSLEARRRDDAVLIRQLGDFIDALEAHIWAGKPPPPPPRPDGI